MEQIQLDGLCCQIVLQKEMFNGHWKGVSAAFKFIQKLWKLNNEILNKEDSMSKSEDITLQKAVNKTVYNVTKNLDNFQYNVVIANIHEIYNLLYESYY